LALSFDSGNDWGCGAHFYGPMASKSPTGPPFATDLDGYSEVVLEAEIPEGLNFQLFLDEATVEEGGTADQAAPAADDGESFKSKPMKGTGKRTIYTIDLAGLAPRKEYGNQSGKHRVDMHSLKCLALYFPGSQGKFSVKVHSLRFGR
jgi:hypothetical protein